MRANPASARRRARSASIRAWISTSKSFWTISSVTGICVSLCSIACELSIDFAIRVRLALHLSVRSLEAVSELLEEIFNDALVVVAPAQDVIERRKTVGLAGLFLVIQLFGVELVIADYAPVIARRIHRKARCESSIDTDDHGVLTGTAVPGEVFAFHEFDHLP